MARVSQITRSSWSQAWHQERGGEQEQLGPGVGIVAVDNLDVKSSPANLHNNQPRSDQAP